ncbi:hypothetical protein DFH09DRAFT_1371250 [Mycena vulgaris]|nr:hypothetical protein DFH09DRAFT_1371250 [Mycena vulgaris]
MPKIPDLDSQLNRYDLDAYQCIGYASRIEGLRPASHTSSTAYPTLARHMSSYQRTQGYVAGAWGSSLPPAALAFAARAQISRARHRSHRLKTPACAHGRTRWLPRAPLRRARMLSALLPRLRTVVLPQTVIPRLLDIASANSARNLETCGFGIFRLTDPPGLQTVHKCTAKQSFHPHPDVLIYTDADRGMFMRAAVGWRSLICSNDERGMWPFHPERDVFIQRYILLPLDSELSEFQNHAARYINILTHT